MNKEGSLFQGSESTATTTEHKEPVFHLSALSLVSEIISFQLSSFQRQPLSFGKWPVIKWFLRFSVFLSCETLRKQTCKEKYKPCNGLGPSDADDKDNSF